MQNKNYRLLKDLPFAKAGEIFESRILDDGKEYMFWGEIKIQNIKNFDEWFEKIKVPKLYFTIDFFRKEVIQISDAGMMAWAIDNIKSLGFLFENREEAEKYLEYLKAKEVIKQDAKGFRPNWNDRNERRYFGYWNSDSNQLDWRQVHIVKEANVYFKSKADILGSFENHPKEWKTYLTYEQ